MQGVLGAFHELDSAIHAIEDLKKAKLGDITVFTPTPRHEFDHVLEHAPSKVRIYTLVMGLAGVTFGYWIPVWISDYWPLVVGGKAIATWVPFTILGFEVMVLIAPYSASLYSLLFRMAANRSSCSTWYGFLCSVFGVIFVPS